MSSSALQLSKCVNRVAVVCMFCMSFTDTFVYTFVHLCVCVLNWITDAVLAFYFSCKQAVCTLRVTDKWQAGLAGSLV